jgi:DASS family divalent anion:Na+ symporter
MTLDQALRGFSNSVTWIIIAAFLFARSFIKTGLGRRIALHFIRGIGSSSMRLGYALSLTDLLLAPVTASNTARSGGIIFPIARALALEFKSDPENSPRRIGAYLLFTAYQSNVVTSAMVLTAMAANALSVQLAHDVAGVEITWGLWFAAAIVPGAVSLALLPWIVHRLYPPELSATPEAIDYARRELELMGLWGYQERVLAVVFVLLGGTWATAAFHAIPTVAAALTAVAILLVLDVLDWNDVISEKPAWATLIWFGGFISLAGALTSSNLITWLIDNARIWLAGWHSLTALILLVVIYTFLHYAFASLTAHIIALYAAFLAIALAAGAPPMLSALILCFFSNLYGTLTHYGDGAAPVFFGSGYIGQRDWWIVGFLLAVVHLVVWLGIGLPYWKLLGIW